MESPKLSYADVLKNASSYLNSSLPVRLVPTAPRTRLSEEAKAKLRAVIHEESSSTEIKKSNEPLITEMKREKQTKLVQGKRGVCQESVTNHSQPLILATASDWVMPGSVMRSAIYDVKKEEKSVYSIRLLKSDEIGVVVREGKLENPIEVYDDSDEGDLSCDEGTSNFEKNDGLEVFDGGNNEVVNEVCEQKCPELNVSLRLDPTEELRRAKRRMEYWFMDDNSLKMKPFKRVDRYIHCSHWRR